MKEKIDYHKKHRREIQQEIPSRIDICCFRVNVENVRDCLITKKDEIIHIMLESYANQLRRRVVEVTRTIILAYGILISMAESLFLLAC